jgi:hypothetical protein
MQPTRVATTMPAEHLDVKCKVYERLDKLVFGFEETNEQEVCKVGQGIRCVYVTCCLLSVRFGQDWKVNNVDVDEEKRKLYLEGDLCNVAHDILSILANEEFRP